MTVGNKVSVVERGLVDVETRFAAMDLSGGAGQAKTSPGLSGRGWDDTSLSGGWETTADADAGEEAESKATDGEGVRDADELPGTANVTLRIGGDGQKAGLGRGALEFVKHQRRPPWTSALGRGFSGMGIHDNKGGPVVARATVTAGAHEGCSPGKKALTAAVPAGMVEAVTARRRSDKLSGRKVAFWANLEGDRKSTPLASLMTA